MRQPESWMKRIDIGELTLIFPMSKYISCMFPTLLSSYTERDIH